MGELYYFLGVSIVQNHKAGNVWIGQPTYTENILKKLGMENAKAVNKLTAAGKKLVKADDCDDDID